VSGARSGPREGILLESLDEITVGSKVFRNVMSIRGNVLNFIQPGDSGSALLAELKKPGQTARVPVVIGLVFATDAALTNLGYACQIAPCLAACNIVPHAKYTF
jgi:hypothetical protein